MKLHVPGYIAYSHKMAPVDTLYLELIVLPLQKIVHYRIVLMLFTYHHAMLPIALQDVYIYIYIQIVHHYMARQHNLLHVPSGKHNKKEPPYVHNNILLYT